VATLWAGDEKCIFHGLSVGLMFEKGMGYNFALYEKKGGWLGAAALAWRSIMKKLLHTSTGGG
jgi:hypothetical protein